MPKTDFRLTSDGVEGFNTTSSKPKPSSSVFPSLFEGDIYTPENILERLLSIEEMKSVKKLITIKEDFYTSPGLMLLSALQAYDMGNDFKTHPPLIQHLIVKYFSK